METTKNWIPPKKTRVKKLYLLKHSNPETILTSTDLMGIFAIY
jgi:hypothetical protein